MAESEKSNQLAIRMPSELASSIEAFSPAMAGYLATLGLPTENVLSPIEERRKVIASLESALEPLSYSERQKAFYLTRFAVAASVGLFNGALTDLWNETMAALRSMVARFDLGYFFSVAEKISSRNKNFQTVEDLEQVADHDLLEACRRIGLLSDVNHKRLEHVNYMRNHASSAHPNQNEIDGFELVGWLTNCLRYAITAKPDHSVIQVKQLLENIRSQAIPASDIPIICQDIAHLSVERIDDLLWTLFGIYIDLRQLPQTKSNIAQMARAVWLVASEDRKYEIGARFGVYRKNADIPRKDATAEFLNIVCGNSYKDEDSLAGELIDKLGTLKTVHYDTNNFYNEYAHAKVLGESLPVSGAVPRAARALWVKVIATCFVGNGYGYREGVDEGALPYYTHYIAAFSESETIEFAHLFFDTEFATPLDRTKCDQRLRQLAHSLRLKSTNIYLQRALDLMLAAPQGTLDRLGITAAFKQAVQYIPKSK